MNTSTAMESEYYYGYSEHEDTGEDSAEVTDSQTIVCDPTHPDPQEAKLACDAVEEQCREAGLDFDGQQCVELAEVTVEDDAEVTDSQNIICDPDHPDPAEAEFACEQVRLACEQAGLGFDGQQCVDMTEEAPQPIIPETGMSELGLATTALGLVAVGTAIVRGTKRFMSTN